MDSHLLRFQEDKKFCFIDFETENLCLNFRGNRPWQVALLECNGSNKINEHDLIIKWEREINVSEGAARITRFSMDKYDKLKIDYKEVFSTMERCLEDCDYIVGHNILGFDAPLIAEYYKMMGKDATHLYNKFIDTFCLSKAFKLGLISKPDGVSLIEWQYKLLSIRKRGLGGRLETMGRDFEIDHNYELLHDALVDLELNLKVWNQLKYKLDI